MMKHLSLMTAFALVMFSCNTEEKDNSADMAFQKNSETVKANLEAWQGENLDYSMYADDFAMLDTRFNAEKDSLSLQEMKEMDKQMWETYDFKMINEPQLLPGVNPDTKKPDGSVRHYSNWEVTVPATDSTEAKSGVINLYESFDFDESGKIRLQQVYGDITGLMTHLQSSE
jgi:hypothetical protein